MTVSTKELLEREERQQKQDIKNVLNSDSGRRLLWRMLGHCGVYRDFEGEQSDILKQIGKRSVGLFLLGILSDADEDLVFKMMREAKNKQMELENGASRNRLLQHSDTLDPADEYFGGSYTSDESDKYGSGSYNDLI